MDRPSKVNNFDMSERAQAALDYMISGAESPKLIRQAARMPVSQALEGEQVLRFSSDRAHSRVLFLTSDAEGLSDTSWIQAHAKDVASVFSEIHIAVVTFGNNKHEYRTKRIDKNVWLYNVNFSSTWFLSHTMDSFAESQLQFTGGFRPDVIVALDPYYAGKAALHLGYQYERPVQIHVLENCFDSSFAAQSKEHKSRVKVAYSVLKKAPSVRTNSNITKEQLAVLFPKIADLGMLPRQIDSDSLLRAKRSNVIKRKYPQYVFTILTAATLDHNNTVYRTLDAARSFLFSPRIGLVIVGDGPMRGELEKRAQILEIKEQVVFEKNTAVLQDYLLSADMFICTDTTTSGDEYVLKAAAAGLPIVMAKTPFRQDLFVDGESGFLCDADNTFQFNQKIAAILNTNAYRQQFGMTARTIIKDRLHTDPQMFRAAYRDSIEMVFGDTGVVAPEATMTKATT